MCALSLPKTELETLLTVSKRESAVLNETKHKKRLPIFMIASSSSFATSEAATEADLPQSFRKLTRLGIQL